MKKLLVNTKELTMTAQDENGKEGWDYPNKAALSQHITSLVRRGYELHLIG